MLCHKISQSVHQSVHQSIHPSIYLSLYPSIHPFLLPRFSFCFIYFGSLLVPETMELPFNLITFYQESCRDSLDQTIVSSFHCCLHLLEHISSNPLYSLLLCSTSVILFTPQFVLPLVLSLLPSSLHLLHSLLFLFHFYHQNYPGIFPCSLPLHWHSAASFF